MCKKLSEMNLKELWQLFPIFLTEHNYRWEDDYKEMEFLLKEKLSDCSIIRISHIGSTAVKCLWAKPIIDILVEIDTNENIEFSAQNIVNSGFIKMSETKNRMSFNYGYTVNGFAKKVYHLHLRYKGDNDELYFRDYLNDYPQIAKEYEYLKLRLWHQYEHNRDMYTNKKSSFVNKYTKQAKNTYGNLY